MPFTMELHRRCSTRRCGTRRRRCSSLVVAPIALWLHRASTTWRADGVPPRRARRAGRHGRPAPSLRALGRRRPRARCRDRARRGGHGDRVGARDPRGLRWAAIAVIVALLLGGGDLLQRHYLEHRYVRAGLVLDPFYEYLQIREPARVVATGTYQLSPLFGPRARNDVVVPIKPWSGRGPTDDGRTLSRMETPRHRARTSRLPAVRDRPLRVGGRRARSGSAPILSCGSSWPTVRARCGASRDRCRSTARRRRPLPRSLRGRR